MTTGRDYRPAAARANVAGSKISSAFPGKIVPAQLPDLIKHPKAMQAMMKMKKIEIAEIERAVQQ
jgi:hypothetical protein